MILADTSLLKDYLDRNPKVYDFVKQYGRRNIAITPFAAVELLKQHYDAVSIRALDGFCVLPVNDAVTAQAFRIYHRYSKAYGIGLAAAFIAAAAITYGLEIRTRCLIDFHFIEGISVSNGYDMN